MQSSKNRSRSLLNSKNASITNPRLVVLDILLKEQRPLTIDQLLRISQGTIAQSTLYRVINDLREFELVSEFTTPENNMVVELNTTDSGHHHHLFCSQCGSITDIELNNDLELELETEARQIEKAYDFLIESHSLELFGLCARCVST
jgi:Fur family ferric uptake transcriptional regulator